MSDSQAITDRVDIEALRGESIDSQIVDDYDRFASLFTPDGMWRVPAVNAEFAGREEIRAGIKRLKTEVWDYLVQTTHPGTIQLDGDTATGRAYVRETRRNGHGRFPCSLLSDRRVRHPALPLRPRHGYAAGLHHGLPSQAAKTRTRVPRP